MGDRLLMNSVVLIFLLLPTPASYVIHASATAKQVLSHVFFFLFVGIKKIYKVFSMLQFGTQKNAH